MFTLSLLLITYLFVIPSPAQAYLDPGTGSYVTQVVIGFLVGGLYVVKLYWHQLTAFIKKLLPRKKKDESQKED